MSEREKSPRVYGPVPSRRYGLSLGVDLLPGKVCSYDCVYCQVGRTRRLQVAREDFFPLAEVLAEVERALGSGPAPDVITLAGSGDASLYRSLGPLIAGLKERAGVPVVLLTNGGLLSDPRVREAAARADVLSPSLDAGDAETFQRINRPHPSIRFEAMVEGLRRAAAGHPGTVRLEIMLVPGLNDGPDQIDRLVELAGSLDLDGIDLNTPVRPAPGRDVRPLDPQTLQALCRRFGPRAEVIARFAGGAGPEKAPEALAPVDEQKVLAALRRRPCPVDELARSMAVDPRALEATLLSLCDRGLVQGREHGGRVFYDAAQAGGDPAET